jgi:hypothetical protein
MAYYVVGPDGSESGPFELDVLIEWARAGQLPATAPVRDAGSQTARPAGQLIELAQHFPPRAAVSGAGNALIPTGNPDALKGYYLGVASLICFIGLLVAPFAVLRSIKGWRAYKRDPSIHGAAHAVMGFVLVGLSVLAHIGLFVLFSQS